MSHTHTHTRIYSIETTTKLCSSCTIQPRVQLLVGHCAGDMEVSNDIQASLNKKLTFKVRKAYERALQSNLKKLK